MADKKKKEETPAEKPEKKAAAPKAKLSNCTLTLDAFQAQGPRTVNTNGGPKTAQAGQWILDLTEGCYVIATDEQVQRLLKK